MPNTDQTIDIVVKVVREDTDDNRKLAKIVFEGLNNASDQDVQINLADSDVNDIKTLFDAVFTRIYESKKRLRFQLDDSEVDLYNQVSKDIIENIEKEIEQSWGNFDKIWQLVSS